MTQRLEALEKYARTHGEALTSLTDRTGDHGKRLDRLEELAQARAITEAREDERDKALYRRLDEMDAKIEKMSKDTKADIAAIRGPLVKAVGIVLGAILLAIVTFMVAGGFAPK